MATQTRGEGKMNAPLLKKTITILITRSLPDLSQRCSSDGLLDYDLDQAYHLPPERHESDKKKP